MTLVRSVLLVLLFTVPVLAQDANESREQRRERNFARRDTNKDGRINDPAKFWTPAIIAKVQDKVSRFQTPLLVLHGDVHPLKHVNMDYIIPAIRDGGKTIEVKIYPGKDHGFYWGRRVDEAFVVAMIEDIHSFAVPLLKTKPVLIDQKFY